MSSGNQTYTQKRFAPARGSAVVDQAAVQVGDWAYVSGYWWRILLELTPTACSRNFVVGRDDVQMTSDLRHVALFKREKSRG